MTTSHDRQQSQTSELSSRGEIHAACVCGGDPYLPHPLPIGSMHLCRVYRINQQSIDQESPSVEGGLWYGRRSVGEALRLEGGPER